MTEKFDKLIASLAQDAADSPVSVGRPVMAPNTIGGVWLLLSLGALAVVMFLFQPWRSGLAAELASSWRLVLEFIVAVVALTCLSVGAFRSAVPGESSRIIYAGIAAMLLWVAIIASGYISPILAPSMAGKREGCSIEAFFYGVILAALVSILLRRRYCLAPNITALAAVSFVAVLPAFLMQIFCMYEVQHGLLHHVLPGLAAAAIAFPFVTIFLGYKR